MEYCSICNSSYKKSFKYDHYKSVKHQEAIRQYYCKKCSLYMPRADKESHLNSNEQKIEPNNDVFAVKIVVNIYLIQQDISKMKVT